MLLMLLSNSSLSPVRLGVDFVLPLSQKQQAQQEPPTFAKATFVQVTFVHIRNISAGTDMILMKL